MRPGCDVACNVGTAELGIGGGNRSLRCGFVEETCIAGVVCIENEKVMGGYVAEIIHTRHHSSPDLMLRADVHLHGTWGDVVGSEEGRAGIEIVRKDVADITTVRRGPGTQNGGLVLLLKLCDLRDHASDWLSAESGGVHASIGKSDGRGAST